MKKVTILFIGALAALLSLAPVAGAKGKHHARTVKVCGIVDATSALPTTLVLATGGTRLVTIQNSTPVELTADIVPGADVCAKAKLVRTAPVAPAARHKSSATKTKVLVSVKVRPAATVQAQGPVTLGTDSVTVATLTFVFPAGFTLSPKVTAGKVVKATGSAALPDGVITLKKLSRSGRHGHSRSHGSSSKNESATISGRVSALTAATATDRRFDHGRRHHASDPGRQGAPLQGRCRRVRHRQRQGQDRCADPEEGQGGEQGRHAGRLARHCTTDRSGGGSTEPPPDVVLDRLQSSAMQRATHADWLTPPANRWAFRHVRELIPTARIRRGEAVRELQPAPVDGLLDLEFAGSDGVVRTLGPYLDESFTDALVVLHDGAVVCEWLRSRRRGRRDAHRDEHLEVDHRAAGRRAGGRGPARYRGAGVRIPARVGGLGVR